MERSVHLLRGYVEELSGALVFCDDMALRERDVLKVFDDIYINSTHRRRAKLLRREVHDAARRYGFEPRPIEHAWHQLHPKPLRDLNDLDV